MPLPSLPAELATAFKSRNKVKFGIYHSLFEWFNPLYLADKAANFTTQEFVKRKTMPELYDLVKKFEPAIIWSDGDWDAPDTYWQSKEFLAWLYNDSPVRDIVVVNDRWGKGTLCRHGGFLTCSDRYKPKHLMSRKYEDATTVDKQSWGYRRNADLSDYRTAKSLLREMVQTISYGGNFLLNVGPRSDGMLDPLMEERLRDIGRWLKVNGEAIYGTKPWIHQNDSTTANLWYIAPSNTKTTVYAIFFKWPRNGKLALAAPVTTLKTKVTLLGYHDGKISNTTNTVRWENQRTDDRGMTVTLPSVTPATVPCQWAWSLKITNLNETQN